MTIIVPHLGWVFCFVIFSAQYHTPPVGGIEFYLFKVRQLILSKSSRYAKFELQIDSVILGGRILSMVMVFL
jgi:hypothetical protein